MIPPQWNATPGSGPRALRFHPNGRIAYCVHELVSQVEVLEWDRQKGTLKSVQKVSLIPDDYHGVTRGSDIVITRDGRFAYAANRDYNCLVSFLCRTEGWQADAAGARIQRRKDPSASGARSHRTMGAGGQRAVGCDFGFCQRREDGQTCGDRKELSCFETAMPGLCLGGIDI